jgi:hypothetical protein
MPITRESQITVLRSIGGSIPDGLTFGEFGFAGANRQLFIGGTGGGASVQSIWIGASITGTAISTIVSDLWPNGNDSQYTLSTTKAVKAYIDAAVGVDGLVSSVNGDTGAITITGAAGGTGAIVVRRTGGNTHIIDARIATNSLTGVASFSSTSFNVGANGAVTLKNSSTSFGVQGNAGGGKFDVILGGTLTLTGSGSIRTVPSQDFSGDGVNVIFDNRIATSSLTGVASFDPRHFAIGLSGHVSLTGSIGADSVRMASATVTGAASFDPRHFAIGLSGHVSLTGSYQVTGDTVVQGGASQVVTRSGNQVTIDNRVATAGATGVASFPSSFFTVSLTGAVNLASAYQATGDTVVQGGASQLVSTVGNTKTIDNRVATASLTGVASFPSSFFTVSLTGAVNLANAYSVTGDTVVQGGASQLVSRSGNQVTIDNRVATTGVTGVASFPSSFFTVSTTGAVNLASAYQVTGHTVLSVGSSQVADTVGNTTRIDNKLATINGQTGVASFSSNFQISSIGKVDLADDVTIAGNLTVQGEVVTANVSNFTVQDTLIKLGTGNNTPGLAYDLGLYMQYPAAGTNNIRLAGFFLDYEDTKFKLFTGLTASAQNGSTGTDEAAKLQTDRQGYTVATLIAKLDGGTF